MRPPHDDGFLLVFLQQKQQECYIRNLQAFSKKISQIIITVVIIISLFDMLST